MIRIIATFLLLAHPSLAQDKDHCQLYLQCMKRLVKQTRICMPQEKAIAPACQVYNQVTQVAKQDIQDKIEELEKCLHDELEKSYEMVYDDECLAQKPQTGEHLLFGDIKTLTLCQPMLQYKYANCKRLEQCCPVASRCTPKGFARAVTGQREVTFDEACTREVSLGNRRKKAKAPTPKAKLLFKEFTQNQPPQRVMPILPTRTQSIPGIFNKLPK